MPVVFPEACCTIAFAVGPGPANRTFERNQTPMPATLQDRSIVHGRLAESHPDRIVLALPGTDYLLHLVVDQPIDLPRNEPIAGRIHAQARRVDVVGTGGRYVEPVYGRPRRLQGRILEVDPQANTITVNGPCPFICELTANQRADQFRPGQLVSFDVLRGARFEWIPAEPTTPEQGESQADDAASVLPPGHLPTEGSQEMTNRRTPGEKTTDHGALTTEGQITGQEKPPADFPISG